MRARLVLPLFLCVLAGQSARADGVLTATGEVTAGGGGDSNPLLVPAAGADPYATPMGGVFGRFAPSLTVALAWGDARPRRLELGWDGDLRAGDDVGRLFHHELSLGFVPFSSAAFRLSMSARAGAFSATQAPLDGFVFGGGEVAVRVQPTDRLRLRGAAALEVRRFRDLPTPRTDHLHVLDLQGSLRLGTSFDAGVRGLALATAPEPGDVASSDTFVRWRLGPNASFVWDRVTIAAWAWGGGVDITSPGPRFQAGAVAGVRVFLTSFLDVVGAAEWTRGFGPDARPFDDRRLVMVGLSTRATARKRWERPEPETSLAPVVRGRSVRFRFRAEHAREIRLIGEWDDWASPGKALVREGDRWEVAVVLPVGRYRYRFVVDGEARRPPDAPRYVTDDFGGEDGLIDTTGTAP